MNTERSQVWFTLRPGAGLWVACLHRDWFAGCSAAILWVGVQVCVVAAHFPLPHATTAASGALHRHDRKRFMKMSTWRRLCSFLNSLIDLVYPPVRTQSHATWCVCNRQVCGRPGQRQVLTVHCRHGRPDVHLLAPHRSPPSSAGLPHRSRSTGQHIGTHRQQKSNLATARPRSLCFQKHMKHFFSSSSLLHTTLKLDTLYSAAQGCMLQACWLCGLCRRWVMQ